MFESVEQLEKEVQEFRQNILASSELIKSIEGLIAATKAQKDSFASESSELLTKMDAHTEALKTSYAEALSKMVKENSKLVSDLSSKGESLLREMQGIPDEVDKRNSAIAAQFETKGGAILQDMQAISEAVDKRNAALAADFQKCSADLKSQTEMLIAQLQAEISKFSKRCDELLLSVQSSNDAHLSNVIKEMQASQKAYIEKLEATDVSIRHCEAEISEKYLDFLAKLESTNIDQMFKMCQEMKSSMDRKFIMLFVGVGASLALMIVSLFIR